MTYHRFLGALIAIPALSALLLLAGCGGGGDEVTVRKKPNTPSKDGKTAGPTTTMVAIEPKEYGVLTGTITYDGDPPLMKQEFKGPDAAVCAMGKGDELLEQVWLVDPATKGVQNVVVFLKVPEGKFFKLKPELRDRKDDVVVLDQPHCAFTPHVIRLFPKYYDEKTNDYLETGQKFRVANSASITHNTKISPVDQGANPSSNETLPPGAKTKDFVFNPDPSGPMKVECNYHTWMNGKIWVFDHPFNAQTDKEGKFKIENVPIGIPVNVVVWHGGAGFVHGGSNGTPTTLKAKDELNLKVKAK